MGRRNGRRGGANYQRTGRGKYWGYGKKKAAIDSNEQKKKKQFDCNRPDHIPANTFDEVKKALIMKVRRDSNFICDGILRGGS